MKISNIATVNSWTTNNDDNLLVWRPWSATEEDSNTFSTFEDIIAISCAIYRMRTTYTDTQIHSNGKNIHTFSIVTDAATIAKSITQEDRLLAQSIRTYYNGKLVVARLRNERLSAFRKDLSTVLNTQIDQDSGKYHYPERFAGLIYKLPYFYEYDQDLVSVFEGEYAEVTSYNNKRCTKELTFIRKLDPYRKRMHRYEYWFADNKDNRVMIVIEQTNPLAALLDYHLEGNPVINIDGNFTVARKDTMDYYVANKWTFNFE